VFSYEYDIWSLTLREQAEYLALRKMKYQKNVEKYMLKSFIICTNQLISLGQ